MDLRLGTSVTIVILVGVISHSAKGAEPIAPAWDRLQTAKIGEGSTYTLRIQMEKPVWSDWPEQGTYSKACTITQRLAEMAIACQTDRLPNLVYVPKDTGNYTARDYGFGENLHVSVSQKQVSLRTKERNDTYEESDVFAIDPRGTASKTGAVRKINHYQPADDLGSWGPSETKQIWWALGQNFEASLRDLTSETVQEDERRRLRIRGCIDSGLREGEWDVLVDPSAAYLIRSASFQFDTSTHPTLEIQTRGLRRFGELALPEEGVIRFPSPDRAQPLEKKVKLLDFSSQPDERLFDKVRQTLDNAAAAGELTIYDYRENPSRPTVTRREQ